MNNKDYITYFCKSTTKPVWISRSLVHRGVVGFGHSIKEAEADRKMKEKSIYV